MRKFFTLFTLILSFIIGFTGKAAANDSDVVNCNHVWNVVVIGSSTSYGTGASVYDSSWVGKITAYFKRKNNQSVVYNFGIPGYTSYQNLCPTGFTPPANRPSPNSSFNITAALNIHPDAIIINMPSNDAANDYTLAEQQANFERAIHLADSANIPVWVTTTQPRNNLSAVEMSNLTAMRDWIITRFGDKAVDFWNTVSNADGTIATFYDYDYVHVNNYGHDLFYKRIQAENILDSLCIRNTQTLVAKAGADISVMLPANSASLNGSGSYSSLGGIITSYSWTTVASPLNSTPQIVSPSSVTTNVNNLVEGRYSFLLTVTDNAGSTKSDTVNVIVSSRILIDFGPDVTASPDANGNYWNTITQTQTGTSLSNFITAGNTTTTIGFQVVNRIDGTFNVAGPGTNTGNTAGVVNDYPATVTSDFSFAEPSATNGQWKITGLESLKQYTIKFWGTRTVSDDRIIQIKRADQTTWQEYNSTNNVNYNTSAIFIFSGKSSMTFDIRVKSGSAFGYISLIDITRTMPAVSVNVPPTARANDVTVSLPGTTGTLDGSASSDDDGTIVSYSWTQTSGPAVAQIVSPTTATSTVNNLIEGIYTFHLVVRDDSSAVSSTDITLTVNSRILIDFGTTPTTGADAAGKYWNNVTDGLPGIKVQNAVVTGNFPTNVSLEIINRIDGIFNTSGPGTNTGNTVGDVGDYPASTTTDYAFAHPSAVNGQWKLAGLDSTKQYTIKFWGTRSVTDQRYIQIKRTDETTYQQYDGANNADYNNAATFTFMGKTSMTFDIKVRDGDAFGYISVLDIKIINPTVVCTPSISIVSNQPLQSCMGTSITFTATASNGGSSPTYQWKLNGVNIDGATATTYTTTTLNNNDSITCVVTTSNFCFNAATATSNSIRAAVASLVAAPGAITGTTSVCLYVGTTTQLTYIIAAVTNATSYIWTLPANVTLVSGQGTTSLVIKYNAGFTAGDLKVKAVGTCNTSTDAVLSIASPTNATPDIISGPTNACAFIGTSLQATYTISKVANATSYVWTVPTGVTIASHPGSTGVNDTIITVTYSSTFVSGTAISVKSSGCVVSAARTLAITRLGAPAAAAAISGITNVCPYTGTTTKVVYTIAKVLYATSYTWAVPSGATFTHTNGTGVNDTTISVTYSSNFTSGNISVTAVNGCGSSAAKTLAITKTAPTGTPVISGPTDPCPLIGTTGGTYKINKLANATSYTWTVPSTGATVTHPNGAGVNDTIIIVTYTSSFTSGSITVKANANCGSSATGALTLARQLPATPGTITTVQLSACPSRQYSYTIPAIPANAISVSWTVPAGGSIISGQGTTNIKVSYTSGLILGNVSVVGTNKCSSGSAKTTSVLLGICLGGKGTEGNVPNPVAAEKVEASIQTNGFDVKVLSNPTYNDFKLIITSDDKKTPIYLRLTDISSKMIEIKNNITPGQTISIGSNYMKGIYIGELIQGNNRKIIKLVKL
ncbi:MAG: GDSL-type esterase/lipase family protein [Ferruginibacter sp.]